VCFVVKKSLRRNEIQDLFPRWDEGDNGVYSSGFYRIFRKMSSLKQFLHSEAVGGVFLMAASVVALALANLPLPEIHAVLHHPAAHFWINDGLMAVFFFVVALEIRREMTEGALSSRARAALPVIAAAGGMAVPALLYALINLGTPEFMHGWAIPAATDIAFAVCVITLLGKRVPPSVKVLLLAIAVIDDLGAIAIIALFYGHGFSLPPFLAGAAMAAAMYGLNRRGARAIWPYAILAAALWYAVYRSGLHPTLAGVVAAMAMPAELDLDRRIHPWVAFLILPLFGLFNAGVSFEGVGFADFAHPVTLGIMAGLLIGKPAGILGVLFLAIRSGLSPMPEGAQWRHLAGMAALCGIGFTMSLFIGGLAFAGPEQEGSIRLGVLGASLVSAMAGFAILRSGR
jgi:NhaA family Na+:H+ antiporter